MQHSLKRSANDSFNTLLMYVYKQIQKATINSAQSYQKSMNEKYKYLLSYSYSYISVSLCSQVVQNKRRQIEQDTSTEYVIFLKLENWARSALFSNAQVGTAPSAFRAPWLAVYTTVCNSGQFLKNSNNPSAEMAAAEFVLGARLSGGFWMAIHYITWSDKPGLNTALSSSNPVTCNRRVSWFDRMRVSRKMTIFFTCRFVQCIATSAVVLSNHAIFSLISASIVTLLSSRPIQVPHNAASSCESSSCWELVLWLEA